MPTPSAKAALGGEIVKPEHPAEQPEALVNEKPVDPKLQEASEVGRLQAQNATLLEENSRLARHLAKEQDRAAQLEMRVQKGGFSDDSRMFRIFLGIIQGFVQRGTLDPQTLAAAAAKGSKSPEESILKHAAGLSQVANKAARDQGF